MQSVTPSIAPNGWMFVALASVAFGDNFITVFSNSTGLVNRGDSLLIGGVEVMMVDYTGPYTVLATTSIIPLARPYLGATLSSFDLFVVDNCTTGSYLVNYSPLVRGVYAVHVMVPSVDEVQQVTFTSMGSLNGSYTLTVRVLSLGVISTQMTAPLFLGAGASSGAAVQSALSSLSNLAAVTVNYSQCSLPSVSCSYTVTFSGLDQNLPLMSLDASGVSGNALQSGVSELTAGSSAVDIVGSPFTLNVIPNVTQAAFTTAYGQGLVEGVTGVQSEFVIQSKDGYGNNRLDFQAQDIYRVHVFLAHQPFGSSVASIDGVVSYSGNGTYTVDYTPTEIGVFTVTPLLAVQLEVQNLTAFWPMSSVRAGYFRLTYGICGSNGGGACTYSQKLSYDSSADAVQSVISSLPGVGPVQVSYAVSTDYLSAAWTVTFLSACDMLPLTIYESSFNITAATVQQGTCSHISTTSNVSLPFPYVNSILVNEVQLVSLNTTACNGAPSCSFSLNYRGYTTPSILTSASASQVQAALESLDSVGTVNVSSSTLGGIVSYSITFEPTAGYTIAHIESFGALPLVQLSSSDLPATALSVVELTRGYSPFAATVIAVTVNASICTAIDSMGVAGFNGLSTGIYEDLTSFKIESRDAYGNRVYLGPVLEVQVVEIYTNATGANLTGSFSLSFNGLSATFDVGTSVDAFAGLLSSQLQLGSVSVTTNSAATPTAITATVIEGGFYATLSLNPSLVFSVGDWIRFVNNVTGPVLAILSIDSFTNIVTLSKPYPGGTATNVAVFIQPNSNRQFIVTFTSLLGDLPAMVLDVTTVTASGGASAYGMLTACDDLTTQSISTSSTGGITGGTFYLSYGASRTAYLPYNVSSSGLEAALEALPGIVEVLVSQTNNGMNAYSWIVTFINMNTTLFPVLFPLFAEGGLLQGVQTSISVNTNSCPFSLTVAGASEQSVSGVIGQTFYAQLDGPPPLNISVRGVPAYEGSGVFNVSYLTPREGIYNLSIFMADAGGLNAVYFNNRYTVI